MFIEGTSDVYRTAAPDLDETALIGQAQSGDRQAFGELVLRHRPGVVNVVYRMCGNPGLAEEAAQEAFVRAWRNLGHYNPRFPFRSWVYRIALNAALDVLRAEKPAAILDALNPGEEPQAPESDQPEALLVQKERAEMVRHAVLALPPECRAALILREYEGLSYQEMAQALDIPLGTVMSRLSYARSLLRRSLAQLAGKALEVV